jgi:hypothetical protein
VPDLSLRTLWGRVDLLYDRRAAEIIDKRGEVARAAVEYDPGFLQYSITTDGAIIQGALSEVHINSAFASCIWRDEHKRKGLLEFVERQLSPACAIRSIRCYAIFGRPSVLTLEQMTESMRDGTNWNGFGLKDRSILTDVAVTYTVELGGPSFTAMCGPMGIEQLKAAVYGSMQDHAPDSLPAPLWYLSLTENGWNPLPSGTTLHTVRPVIGDRFNAWGEFADEFLKGK